MEETQPLLVTKRQAARLLSVSESTIDNLIRTGELASVQIRARRLVEYRALEALATGAEQEKVSSFES